MAVTKPGWNNGGYWQNRKPGKLMTKRSIVFYIVTPVIFGCRIHTPFQVQYLDFTKIDRLTFTLQSNESLFQKLAINLDRRVIAVGHTASYLCPIAWLAPDRVARPTLA